MGHKADVPKGAGFSEDQMSTDRRSGGERREGREQERNRAALLKRGKEGRKRRKTTHGKITQKEKLQKTSRTALSSRNRCKENGIEGIPGGKAVQELD